MNKSVSFIQAKTQLNLLLLLTLLTVCQLRRNRQGKILQGLKPREVSLFVLKESFYTKFKACKDPSDFLGESCIKEKEIKPFLINYQTVLLLPKLA